MHVAEELQHGPLAQQFTVHCNWRSAGRADDPPEACCIESPLLLSRNALKALMDVKQLLCMCDEQASAAWAPWPGVLQLAVDEHRPPGCSQAG